MPAVFWVFDHQENGQPLAKLVEEAFIQRRIGYAVAGYILSDDIYRLPITESSEYETNDRVKKPLDTSFHPFTEVLLPIPFLPKDSLVVAKETRAISDSKIIEDNDKIGISSSQEINLIDVLVTDLKSLGVIENFDNVNKVLSQLAQNRTEPLIYLLKGSSDFNYELAQLHARKEPHEAVVLVYKPQDMKELFGVRIGSSGSWFFHCDSNSCDESGMDIPGEPGIYFFDGGKPWSSGDGVWDDYESGIDGKYDDVKLEHLEKFGFTLQSFKDELIDVLEEELPSGTDPLVWLKDSGANLPEWIKNINEDKNTI